MSGKFILSTVYQAVINLAAKTGYTFDGVGADSFIYDGATSVTNEAGNGDTITVTISFPETAMQPVTNITGVPALGTEGVTLALNGTVRPANATNRTIAWSVKTPGGTGADISGNSLSTIAAGTVVVTATIADGTAVGTDYTQDFSITVRPVVFTETVVGVGYTFKAVPAGTVTANIGESGGPFYDAGTTPVTVSAFYMGETEITYELWDTVYQWAASNGYTFDNPGLQGGDYSYSGSVVGTNQHPVTTISWRDAVVWCNAYSEAAGKAPVYYLEGTSDFRDTTKVLRESGGSGADSGDGKAEKAVIYSNANGYRLPTDAEWEYAARGGVPGPGTPWTYTYAGSDTVGEVAVYNGNSGGQTAAVKSKTGGLYNGANSLGLYDMSGNVWEWCWDATGTSRVERVQRAGSWYASALGCEVANRGVYIGPGARLVDLGFRVACP
jgi:formylglycine-generating enzyme required for sulfatase activity